MCNINWSNEELIHHLGELEVEESMYPYDGSIELEKMAAQELLAIRGVLDEVYFQ